MAIQSSLSASVQVFDSRIYIRDLILLTFALSDKPLDVQDSYTLAKNLELRIKSKLAFDLPSFSVYERIIHKMLKKNLLVSEYNAKTERYSIHLSESAEGEVDFLLYSNFDQAYYASFDEFKKLVSYLA